MYVQREFLIKSSLFAPNQNSIRNKRNNIMNEKPLPTQTNIDRIKSISFRRKCEAQLITLHECISFEILHSLQICTELFFPG